MFMCLSYSCMLIIANGVVNCEFHVLLPQFESLRQPGGSVTGYYGIFAQTYIELLSSLSSVADAWHQQSSNSSTARRYLLALISAPYLLIPSPPASSFTCLPHPPYAWTYMCACIIPIISVCSPVSLSVSR